MSDATVSFDEAAAQRAPSDVKHDRSTIEFSYGDLDDALGVVQAIYARAGLGSCEMDELAAQMNQTVSGSFRMKTSAARLFGLVEKEGRSGYRLSVLGRRVVQNETEGEARATAFLNVPLHKEIFEKYRGHLLPPTKALEREMVALGVAPKQADKARQSFERSARQAGFFAQGSDRLVQPRVESRPETKPVEEADHSGGGGRGRGGNGSGPSGGSFGASFKSELLAKFPPFDPAWNDELKAEWFKGFQQFMALAKNEE